VVGSCLKIAGGDEAEEGDVLVPWRGDAWWGGEQRGAWRGRWAAFGALGGVIGGWFGGGFAGAAEDGRGRDAEHVAEGAEDATCGGVAGDEGVKFGIFQQGLDVDAAVRGCVALGDGGWDEADQPGELVRRARGRGWRGFGCSRIGCYGVGRGFWRADADGGLWFWGGIGDVFGDEDGEAVDHAGEAGVDEGDEPGGEPDLVAALADIGPEAADDGGEAVGQRGERRCMCHTLISAWGVGG
jgi:hypothetical protein